MLGCVCAGSIIGGVSNDVALLRLERAVTWDQYVQPICLPAPGLKTDGMEATVTGWGTLFFGNKLLNLQNQKSK